jgi:Secretion system C-terminal sorting domain
MSEKLIRLSILFVLIFFTNSVFSQYIPDIAFRRQIRAECPDCIDASNNLLPAAQNLGYLDLVGVAGGFPMRNIQGIEGFTRLKTLNITDALNLTQIDVLPLQLTSLYIYNAPSLAKLDAFLSDSMTKLYLINVAIDSIKQVLPKELIELNIKDDSLKYIKAFSSKIRTMTLIPQSYPKAEAWPSTLTLPTRMSDSLKTATIKGWQFTNKTFQFPEYMEQLSLTHTNLENIDFLPKKLASFYYLDLSNNRKLKNIKFPEECSSIHLDSAIQLKCLPPITQKCYNIYPYPSSPQVGYKCFVNNPFNYYDGNYQRYQNSLCAKNNPNRCYTTKTFISGRITFKGQDSIERYIKAIIRDSANRWFTATLDSSGFYTAEIDAPMVTTFSPFVNIPGITSAPAKRTITAQDTIGGYYTNQDFVFGGNFTDAGVYFYNGPARPGFSSVSTLMLNNWGTTTITNAKLTLTLDPKQTYESATVSPTSIVGNVLTWNLDYIPTSGRQDINVTLKTLVNAPLGSFVTTTAVFTDLSARDIDTSNNRSVSSREVRGSYDPNDIAVDKTQYSPKWGAPQNAVVPLVYTIRFQNTGNADAIRVVVVDTIPDKLDITTYQELNRSHYNTPELIKSGNYTIIRWVFNYIYLPAASINEKESHGFIQYKINNTPSKTNYARDSILNKAAIYFDFNPPIITNTAKTFFLISATGEIGRNTIKVYPNPTNDLIAIDSEKSLDGIAIFTNLMGQVVAQKSISGRNQTLSIGQYPKGLYIMSIKTKEGQWSTKILKQDAF